MVLLWARVRCSLQHLGSSAWTPAEFWIQEHSPLLCSPTFDGILVVSSWKLSDGQRNFCPEEQTLLSLPVSWRSARDHADAPASLQPAQHWGFSSTEALLRSWPWTDVVMKWHISLLQVQQFVLQLLSNPNSALLHHPTSYFPITGIIPPH